MKVTVQIKLIPTAEQATWPKATMQECMHLIKQASKTVSANPPSAAKSQCIQDARSVYKKNTKYQRKAEYWNQENPNKPARSAMFSVLKKQVCIWNIQNWKYDSRAIHSQSL